MTLSSMSIDEAIALACREVPECKVDYELYGGQIGVRVSGYEINEQASGTVLCRPGDEGHSSLWFHAAWEWLIRFGDAPEFYRVIGYTTGWAVDKVKYLGGGLESTSDVGLVLPTKYHALAAACLLAAGKDVP